MVKSFLRIPESKNGFLKEESEVLFSKNIVFDDKMNSFSELCQNFFLKYNDINLEIR